MTWESPVGGSDVGSVCINRTHVYTDCYPLYIISVFAINGVNIIYITLIKYRLITAQFLCYFPAFSATRIAGWGFWRVG